MHIYTSKPQIKIYGKHRYSHIHLRSRARVHTNTDAHRTDDDTDTTTIQVHDTGTRYSYSNSDSNNAHVRQTTSGTANILTTSSEFEITISSRVEEAGQDWIIQELNCISIRHTGDRRPLRDSGGVLVCDGTLVLTSWGDERSP